MFTDSPIGLKISVQILLQILEVSRFSISFPTIARDIAIFTFTKILSFILYDSRERTNSHVSFLHELSPSSKTVGHD